jgi:hypothetical protein
MSIFRLLPFSLLIAAATLAAQSTPQRNPDALQSTNSGQLNIRGGARLNQFSLQPTSAFDSNGQVQPDTLCYSMRSFKVARDEPQSDSTHPAGYSTCQPAASFHVHSIQGGTPPAKP